jgi:hypothetical protein
MKQYTYNPDKLLSENFRLGEFIESETAQRLGIDNTPTVEVVFRLRNLCREVLQPLRDHVGHAIRINSGYRCEALNEAVHGVGNSQHLHGCAADIHVPDIDTARIIERNCSVKRSDVLAVLTELGEVIRDQIRNSHRVRLVGIGSLMAGLHGKPCDDPQHYSNDLITDIHLCFKPDKELRLDDSETTQLPP